MEQEQSRTAQINLISEIRRVRGLKNVIQSTHILESKNKSQANFPHIQFLKNDKIQIGDEDRQFYIRPISAEYNNQPLEPFQFFPKNLISALVLKSSKLGHKIYLMKCVSSPLFIHRKHDVIKMSIDYKSAEIKSVLYQQFFDLDMLGVVINTAEGVHLSLISLRTLRILKHVFIEQTQTTMIAILLLKEKAGSFLVGIDNKGYIYLDGDLIGQPKLGKISYFLFFRE